MEKIEKHVLIDAPVSVIFRYVNEPFNLLQISPGVIEISNVIRLRTGGRNFQCVSKMVSTRILYTAECIEHIVNRQLGHKISGGLQGTMRWQFEESSGQTSVIFVLEYEVPLPLLKHHAESEIASQTERDVQQLLSNLKTVIERQTQVSM
jgi:uncharacterized membrane protein